MKNALIGLAGLMALGLLTACGQNGSSAQPTPIYATSACNSTVSPYSTTTATTATCCGAYAVWNGTTCVPTTTTTGAVTAPANFWTPAGTNPYYGTTPGNLYYPYYWP